MAGTASTRKSVRHDNAGLCPSRITYVHLGRTVGQFILDTVPYLQLMKSPPFQNRAVEIDLLWLPGNEPETVAKPDDFSLEGVLFHGVSLF